MCHPLQQVALRSILNPRFFVGFANMGMQRKMLLPMAFLVLATFALLDGQSAFVGQSVSTGTAPNLRTTTGRRALPVEIIESSIGTALAVSQPGFAANIVFVSVPVIFLVTLYLQSERTKREWEEAEDTVVTEQQGALENRPWGECMEKGKAFHHQQFRTADDLRPG